LGEDAGAGERIDLALQARGLCVDKLGQLGEIPLAVGLGEGCNENLPPDMWEERSEDG